MILKPNLFLSLLCEPADGVILLPLTAKTDIPTDFPVDAGIRFFLHTHSFYLSPSLLALPFFLLLAPGFRWYYFPPLLPHHTTRRFAFPNIHLTHTLTHSLTGKHVNLRNVKHSLSLIKNVPGEALSLRCGQEQANEATDMIDQDKIRNCSPRRVPSLGQKGSGRKDVPSVLSGSRGIHTSHRCMWNGTKKCRLAGIGRAPLRRVTTSEELDSL